MKVALSAFQQRLNEIRGYVRLLDANNRLLSFDSGSSEPSYVELMLREIGDAMPSLASRRRIEYSSIIVSLYGAWEQFLEEMLRAMSRHLNEVYERYSMLPVKVTDYHLTTSASLLSRFNETRYRNIVSPLQIVANLQQCLSDAKEYQINEYAFSHHTSNFRVELIDSSFGNLGCQSVSARIRVCSRFADLLQERFPTEDVSQKKASDLYFVINDLAERRNLVAHGTVVDILSHEILLSYLEFCEEVGIALFEVLRSDAINLLVDRRGRALGRPIKVIDGRIVCIRVFGVTIRKGDLLVAKTGSHPIVFVGGEILEMQIDRKGCEEIVADAATDVALRFDAHAKDNHEFFVISRERGAWAACT